MQTCKGKQTAKQTRYIYIYNKNRQKRHIINKYKKLCIYIYIYTCILCTNNEIR